MSSNSFLSQLDLNLLSQGYNFEINSTEDVVWDMVVVYGFNVKWNVIKCKEGNVVFIAPEPPLMYPIPDEFLHQFDHIVSCNPELPHPNNHINQQSLNWHYAISYHDGSVKYNYEEYLNLNPIKTKNISLIMSSQKLMPGHNRRLKIYKNLKADFGDIIDYFGKGINQINFKEEGIAPYKFHICMENSSIPNYWTEKIADPLIGRSIPIYAGCTNISDYFVEDGYLKFDIKDYSSLKHIIEYILKDPQAIYEKHLPIMLQCRNLLMNKYNIYHSLISFFNENCSKKNNFTKEYSFLKNTECKGYKKAFYQIRFSRKITNLLIQIGAK